MSDLSAAIEKFIFPESIDASQNVRRACKNLINRGYLPWQMALNHGLSNNCTSNLTFIKTFSEFEPEIVSLAQSISECGQLNAVICTFTGPIHKVIAGQRRCLAIVYLEAMRRILNYGTEEIIDEMMEAQKDFQFGYDKIQENEEGFFIKAKIISVTKDVADNIAFEENDQSMPIGDLDWGMEFCRLSTIINPDTGKNYTFKEIAIKRKKPYQFVIGRAALPFLPDDWKLKLDEGILNITDCINYAKECKEKAIAEGASAPPSDGPAMPVVDSIPLESVYSIDGGAGEESLPKLPTKEEEEAPASGKSWATATRKPRTKKKLDRMKRKDILGLLASVDPKEKVAIKLLSEILFISEADADKIAMKTIDVEEFM